MPVGLFDAFLVLVGLVSSSGVYIAEEKTGVVDWAWHGPTCPSDRSQQDTRNCGHIPIYPSKFTLNLLSACSLERWDASQPPQVLQNQPVQPQLKQTHHAPYSPPNQPAQLVPLQHPHLTPPYLRHPVSRPTIPIATVYLRPQPASHDGTRTC